MCVNTPSPWQPDERNEISQHHKAHHDEGDQAWSEGEAPEMKKRYRIGMYEI